MKKDYELDYVEVYSAMALSHRVKQLKAGFSY
jgi:hypothetical protein